MSQEYIGAIVLLLGAILKAFNIEIPNETVEAVIAGAIALWIAVRRFKKGDINVLGGKK
jgi:uncharacterized membrane protein